MEPFTMLMLATAAMGAMQGQRAAKARKDEANFRKNSIRYSPWTNLGDPGASDIQGDPLSGGIQGGLTGAMLGNAMKMKGAENWFGKQGAAPSDSLDAQTANLDKEVSDIGANQMKRMSFTPGSPAAPGAGPYTTLQANQAVPDPTVEEIDAMVMDDYENTKMLQDEEQRLRKLRGGR